MARALIDFTAEIFSGDPQQSVFAHNIGKMFEALHTFGLKVIGSAPSPMMCDGGSVIRLIVEDGMPAVLPAECAEGWRIVCPQFVLESHGDQRIVKVTKVSVVGRPHLQLAA